MSELVVPARVQASAADVEGITLACRDYVEGWYDAEPDRMRRCLHPDLVKRTVMRDPESGAWRLRRSTSAEMMVDYTRQGGGSEVQEAERRHQIILDDVFRHVACARIISPLYVDYVHLAQVDGRWKLVNVLWELRDGEMGPEE